MKFRSAAGHPAIRSNTRRCIWTACTRAYAIAWKSCAAMKFRPTSILCRARARCSRLVGGHQPSALLDECFQLRALRVAEVGDIGQGQDFELLQVRRVELIVGNHFEGNPAFHQGVVEPRGVVRRGPPLLGGHEPDASQRPLVAEILLVLPVPDVKVLDGLEPALIERLGIELDYPGPEALGDAIHGPQPHLIGVLAGVLPAVSRLVSDAEYAHDGLGDGDRAGILGILAVLPGQLEFGAALPVRKENRHGNALFYLLESVGKIYGTGVLLSDFAIPESVQLQESFPLPCGELTVRVAWRACRRPCGSGCPAAPCTS